MILLENLQPISPQQAKDKHLFGPVYHGATSDKLGQIGKEGFKVFYSDRERSGQTTHGLQIGDYVGGIPAPVHFLGFGVYFTTTKAIALQFGYGNRNIGPYFLDVPVVEKINWGSPRTMMKWWQENGYNMEPVKSWRMAATGMWHDITVMSKVPGEDMSMEEIRNKRFQATMNLTNNLKSKYDAVWYKGKGIHRLLDGDQICVYEPEGKIYVIDKTLIKPGEIGSKIIASVDIDPYGRGVEIPKGTKGIIIDKQFLEPEYRQYHGNTEWVYEIKWERGGTQSMVRQEWIEPYTKRKQLEENIIYRRSFWKDYENVVKEGDEDHADALHKTGYWGRQGAGAIILAKSTGRILLPFRSRYVEQPHTWGVWGGAIDENEDPATAVKREIHEEVGYAGPMQLLPMYVFEDPRVGFRYSNFLAIVPDEFEPHRQWETERSEWVEFGNWPSPLHFGLKALLQHSGRDIENAIQKIRKI